jgi:hypothetical protein
LFSRAALLQPPSTIDQNGSGLLETNATAGRLPDGAAVDDLEELQAGVAAITAAKSNVFNRFIFNPP